MKYKIMFFLVQHKLISEKMWRKYCDKIFVRLLIENQDVFIRLKNM